MILLSKACIQFNHDHNELHKFLYSMFIMLECEDISINVILCAYIFHEKNYKLQMESFFIHKAQNLTT